jgi:hypothetical protein
MLLPLRSQAVLLWLLLLLQAQQAQSSLFTHVPTISHTYPPMFQHYHVASAPKLVSHQAYLHVCRMLLLQHCHSLPRVCAQQQQPLPQLAALQALD